MCGLLGFYPKKNKKVDLTKLFPLWILNEDRGIHSCGISYGDKRIGGVLKLSKARDLIDNIYDTILQEDLTNKPIICHTRHATSGQHTDDNAHPFKWYRKDESNFFMFAHNGVIRSLYELKKKLGMSRHNDSMMNIDSQVLGLAVYDSYVDILSEKEILTQYEGNAAFICYDVNNVFKVWKGANNDVEERPLYYVETKDGWYFCSIKASLKNIFLTEPLLVENNTLMTFKNYKFYDSKVFSRSIEDVTSLVSSSIVNYKDTRSSSVNAFKSLMGSTNSNYTPLNIIKNAVTLTLSSIIKPIKNNNEFIGDIITIATYGFNNTKGKYILKSNSNPIDGNHLLEVLDKNVIISNKGYSNTFSKGVLLKKNHLYDDIQEAFWSCLASNLSYEDTFSTLYVMCEEAIVDFIPLYDKNSALQCIIYKVDNYLDYITIHDTTPRIIPSQLGFKMQAYPANKTLFLNLYHS